MVDASLVNTNLAAGAAIAFSKLAALTSAQILVGNGSNVPTAVAVTGDISINNAGLTAISSGVIVDGDISGSAAITGSKVTTGTTSAVGVLQLTDSATSTSATTAATPAAVKIAKDAADAAATTANAALPKAGGTLTDNLIIDNGKELRLSEGDSDGANYTGLKAQAQSGDITLTLPAVAPTANQVLKADASTPTTLTWATDSSTDATKMPLVGGTFTGDVTFTGDSSNGLWDKSASAFVANLTGNVTGNASGSAATVTGAAQSAITSLGTLTGLTVNGDVTFDGATAGRDIVFDKSRDALAFKDNAYAEFGDSPDLQIYHSGSDSFIKEIGTGQLHIQADNLILENAAGANYLTGISGGEVILYHNDQQKFVSTATGATITGTLVADGLTVDTNTLHVDATNNRVGIGITSPTQLLEINGASSPCVLVKDTTNNVISYLFADDTNAYVGSASDHPVIIKQNNGTAVTIDTSKNVTFAGGVGCGAAPGSYKLQVTEGSGNEIARFSGANSSNLVFRNATSNEMLLYVPSGDSLKFATNGYANVALTLDSSQNATFAGSAIINGDPTNGVNQGIELSSSGYIEVCNTNDNYYVWKGYKQGSGGGNGTLTSSVLVDGTATFASSVSDSKGNLRSIPYQDETGSTHTLIAADAGKTVGANNGVTIPASVLGAGDAVTIICHSGSDITLTQGSGLSLYNTADASTGNRTLAARGMATVYFVSATIAYISGAGLS